MKRMAGYVVRRHGDEVSGKIEELSIDDLPDGDVLIEVAYSSVNYKDALASSGHRGVVARLPHVPGIDVAGRVVESADGRYAPGDDVFITGYGLGADTWGGWCTHVRVPGDWIVTPPSGLSLRDSMIFGTAGFTAAQCVDSIVRHDRQPGDGPVVVTGATGGVGIMATKILSHLGYEVVAVTGKTERHDWLKQHGASEIITRGEFIDTGDRPMLASRFAAAVDTVGGPTLSTVIRSLSYRGCVAACGLVGGDDLPISVYPFILRGVSLDGIDSAKCPRSPREAMWHQLAGAWKPAGLDDLVTEVPLFDVATSIDAIKRGQVAGRHLVVL